MGKIGHSSTPEEGISALSEQAARFFREQIGVPTYAQAQAWPRIAAGGDVLISAPTGTGKTLAAFLVFIDKLMDRQKKGELAQETHLIYISPLKALAADIRENLRRPLEGIEGAKAIRVAVRTGDTTQAERARMARRPPHILITTPESLFLMLTSRSGQGILRTARAIIIDELHALIDTKRGAHLMLSIARLECLCGHNLQRVGLSATIEPLGLAARYLSPAGVDVVAPQIEKRISIKISGVQPLSSRDYSPIWEEIAREIYERCQETRSVIAFTEARRYAEKLSYYVNQLGGEGFSRVHHGSLSREQRRETEEALRAGQLRLLCATSSMELGIDVGDIDEVLQIGCPRTVSGTMQRLGRAGHNPGRVSVMVMYPRTPLEAIYCGMTAQEAILGGVEEAKPPRLCLDVLCQHLVSMAAQGEYSVDDVMEMLKGTYSFRDVTRREVIACLMMLAGEKEHRREIPVRPRILYDPLRERVSGDAYSRMLAVSAGGTIPDKGMYAARTESGVKIGELDEEFVYETYIGDRFLLGAFGWRVLRIDKDSVIVAPTGSSGGRVPFWKGERKGRALKTSLAFGRMMRRLGEAHAQGGAQALLKTWGLDDTASKTAVDLLARQMLATGALPDDRTVVIERFTDSNGSHQLMIHAFFGRRINAPLSLLLQHAAKEREGIITGCVEEEDGILLYPYGEEVLPEGLLSTIDPERVRPILEAMLPATPLFGMTFRYNAARALMMGMHRRSRQPLWMQRLRGAELLDAVKDDLHHPLIEETRRECLEDQWDISGLEGVLRAIRAGQIAVREVNVQTPSPFSLPLQWQVEAAEMYAYSPVTDGVRQAAAEQLKVAEMIKPTREELERVHPHARRTKDAKELYGLLQMEGDFTAQELLSEQMAVPLEWLNALSVKGLAVYVEPGLWIAVQAQEEYANAFARQDTQALRGIVRRLLYYKGPHNAQEIAERYALTQKSADELLEGLYAQGEAMVDGGMYYHIRRYERAQRATVYARRQETPACPAQRYAALRATQVERSAPPEEQLAAAIKDLRARAFPAAMWEDVILPRRVLGYREAMLDKLLAQGEFVWRMQSDGRLYFLHEGDIDWDARLAQEEDAPEEDAEQALIYQELIRRGASFVRPLARLLEERNMEGAKAQAALLELARKGIVYADSFVPVRQLLAWEKIEKAPAKQRARMRAQAMNAGRWDRVRPAQSLTAEETLEKLLEREMIVCRETFRIAMEEWATGREAFSWTQALEILRMWEYTGRVRRGYFVAGLSGAQYVAAGKYEALRYALSHDARETVWLHAQDPALCWGRELETPRDTKGQPLRRMSGCAVALCGGHAALCFEQNGRVLRVLSEELLSREAMAEEILCAFVAAYREKRIFPRLRRVTVKSYPPVYAKALEHAGFRREMLDYVLESGRL